MAVTQGRKDTEVRTGAKSIGGSQTASEQAYSAQKSASPYTGMAGVNENTAQQLGNYNQGYQAGQNVQNAQQMLQSVQDQKPQGYTSKYSTALDEILQQIQNPEKFKYSFNDDELFRYYADLYTQKGKQAALDTQGQAAALTGGYGNSYGAMAGNQAYQQYLLSLYDKGMDLRDRAYQQYRDNISDLNDRYSLISGQDETDYNRYRDEVGDWSDERDYWATRYDTESTRDYDRYTDQRDYWADLAANENTDYRNQLDYEETKRQFDEDLAETRREFDEEYEYNKMSDAQQYAYNYVMSIVENGQMPSDELLAAAGLSAEDAAKMIATVEEVVSGGGSDDNENGEDKPEVKTYGGLSYYKAKAAVDAGTDTARARAEEEYWQPKRAQNNAEGARVTGPEKAYKYKTTK